MSSVQILKIHGDITEYINVIDSRFINFWCIIMAMIKGTRSKIKSLSCFDIYIK